MPSKQLRVLSLRKMEGRDIEDIFRLCHKSKFFLAKDGTVLR